MRRLMALLALAACGVGCTRDAPPGDVAEPPAAVSRFVAVSTDSARDTTTGLVWTTRDHERDLPWPEAEAYCDALRVDEQSGWRLPEIDELVAIYDDTQSRACGANSCRLDPAIAITGPYVWSGSGRGDGRRFYIDFKFGTQLAPLIRPRLVRRVLCVRDE